MKRIIFLFWALYAISAHAGSLPIYYKSDYYPNRMVHMGDYICIVSEKGVTYYSEWPGTTWFYDNAHFHTKDTITCIAMDKNNIMWLGTFGDGIFKRTLNSAKNFLTFHYNYYWKDATPLTCYSIAFDSENNPWAAGVYYYMDCNKEEAFPVASAWYCSAHAGMKIMDMKFDSKDNLWMAVDHAVHTYLACHERGATASTAVLEGTAATSLAIDSKDNIWVTCTDGIHYYEPGTKKNTLYAHENHPEIPKALYTACDIDQDGNVWFITSQLLLKYDGKNFTQYTCEDFNEARSILCGKGNVWVYTKNNILLKFKNNEFTSIDLDSQQTGFMKEKSKAPLFSATYNADGTITVAGDIAINEVDIYDLSGILISTIAGEGKNRVHIKGNGLPGKDLYLIKVRHAQGESMVKMIK
ncbi:two-component regulator propeller domain-containing protein [Bacteroides sp.]